MKDLVPSLNTAIPEPEDTSLKSHSEDLLGGMLQGKWSAWSAARLNTERTWLEDLRAFNQINEVDAAKLSKFHSHIYVGLTRTKCLSAYTRVTDIMLGSRDRHWGVETTPVPESDLNTPGIQDFIDEMKKRAELMEVEIADQLIDLRYDDHLRSCTLEGSIIGTGCIKGIIPGTKKIEKWGFIADPVTGAKSWDVVKSETPTPQMSAPSVFDLYPDPFATCIEDMSGIFERHILTRAQFTELEDDPHFDKAKIKEILTTSENGNHAPLYHEMERRDIAGTNNTVGTDANRYDLLEYWGEVTGRRLKSAGVGGDIEDSDTYWANVWVCAGKTLLARIAPMKKQRIPYNFFIYTKIPHQFWGVSPGRMMRTSQLTMNGSVRALLDGMVMAAYPMAEVNATMLKDSQDPRVMLPGQVYVRDSGDPGTPCVRFFQPQIPTAQLMQMAQLFRSSADDESMLPAYTYGDTSNEINKTSSGMSMQLSQAALPIKGVIKNLEDGTVKSVIESLFDWNMEWSDREDIKGDHKIVVLGTSALLAKEQKSQALMQFLNITANPIDMKFVDRKYLLEQVAKALEIDTKKALPAILPEAQNPPPPPPPLLDQAKTQLLQVQAEVQKATVDKMVADTANVNINSQFSATQAAAQLLTNAGLVEVADQLLLSAGYIDANGSPIAQPQSQPGQQAMPPGMQAAQQIQAPPVQENTSPQFPPRVQEPSMPTSTPPNNVPNEMKMPK